MAQSPLHPDNDYRFNGRLYTPDSLCHPLLVASRHSPRAIDNLLRPYLSSPTFPTQLESLMKEYVSTLVTPGFHGLGIRSRPRWFYANCALFGLLLSRAFALLSTPTRPPASLDSAKEFPFSRLPAELRLLVYAYYKEDLAQRQRVWEVMSRVFIKGLWSGRDAEEGARYAAGIMVLASGHAMSLNAALLRGRGRRYVWWDDRVEDLEYTWGWKELRQALLATKELPRYNTDVLALYRAEELDQEYVSREVLEVLDLAREHLLADERDWTPPEIEARLMKDLFDHEEARNIWQETGMVPRAFEPRYGEERACIRYPY